MVAFSVPRAGLVALSLAAFLAAVVTLRMTVPLRAGVDRVRGSSSSPRSSTAQPTAATNLRPAAPENGGNSGTCSCWNSTSTERCCHRAILTAHKFGSFLGRKLLAEPLASQGRRIRRPPFSPSLVPVDGDASQRQPPPDYRHVGIVRNVFAALVSGYLYHRSGHECWLSPNGKPMKEKHGNFHIPMNLTLKGRLVNLADYRHSATGPSASTLSTRTRRRE